MDRWQDVCTKFRGQVKGTWLARAFGWLRRCDGSKAGGEVRAQEPAQGQGTKSKSHCAECDPASKAKARVSAVDPCAGHAE
eukprot:13719150-Alexandrium_andersonii.AAC.1